jgi:hypothetical protein
MVYIDTLQNSNWQTGSSYKQPCAGAQLRSRDQPTGECREPGIPRLAKQHG